MNTLQALARVLGDNIIAIITRAALTVLLLLSVACSDGGARLSLPLLPDPEPFVASSSEIDFGECLQIATGIAVSKTSIESNVPADVPVFSLTDIGFVFEGSDDLAVLVVRVVTCDSIAVTAEDGTVETEGRVVWTQVGTPFSAEGWPASQFSYDGVNAADVTNYTISYTTNSSAFYDALVRAGLQGAKFNDDLSFETIDLDEMNCDTSSIIADVGGDDDFAFSISGTVPEATAECDIDDISEIANWWSIDEDKNVATASNQLGGETLLFFDGNTADVFITTKPGTEINTIIGMDVSRFTAFAVSGYMPDVLELDIITGPVGVLGQ